MKIERHKIDEGRIDEMRKNLDHDFQLLAETAEAARRQSANLDSLISVARIAAGRQFLFDLKSPRGRDALRLAARASAGLFATVGASSAHPVTIVLKEGELPVTYTSSPDESTVHVGKWIQGFYLAKIVRDRESVDLLCQTDPMSLRKSSTRGPEYLFLYAKALRDFHTLQWTKIVDTIMAAIRATDPNRPDVYVKEAALDLQVPELEVLIYAVTKDARFGDALGRAVELHKKFWSKKKDFRMQDSKGFISVPLTGLARIGLDQGLTFDVDSPYVPRELLE